MKYNIVLLFILTACKGATSYLIKTIKITKRKFELITGHQTAVHQNPLKDIPFTAVTLTDQNTVTTITQYIQDDKLATVVDIPPNLKETELGSFLL